MSNTANVTAGKPRISGAVMYAELSSNPTIPTATSSEVPTGFTSLGYVSEDGVTNNNSASSTQVKAWGGDIVMSMQTEKPDTFKFTLLEAENIDVLKVVYGEDNVTGETLASGLTIKANNTQQTAKAFVIDVIMTGNTLKRIVVPNSIISEVGEVTYKDDEAVAYEITLQAMPDAQGNTHYEYLKTA